MKRQSLYFTAARQTELREEQLPAPVAGELRVEAICSAISPGTELLIYKGEAPQDLPADDTLAALRGSLAYPLKYGYCMVGTVAQVGEGVSPDWKGRQVFAFNPHESRFNAPVAEVLALPEGCSPQDAAFLPLMETAVNVVLDSRPILNESVAVLGQGILGLMVTALLARFPLAALLTMDKIPARRELSMQQGATASLDPAEAGEAHRILGPGGADLVVEVSGRPEALNTAMQLVGDFGRVVVGSWYGTRTAPIELGGRFHRGRVQLISSQVSHIAPGLSGRWDRPRRFAAAWPALMALQPSRWATRLPFSQAGQAYQQLDQHPEAQLAVLLSYDE